MNYFADRFDNQQERLLKHYNTLLAFRISGSKAIYPICITLICFFLSMIPIAAYLERTNMTNNIIIGIQATIYLYLMFELLVLTVRFKTDTVILQDKLSIFPISLKIIYLYLLKTAFLNIKNLYYFVPFALIVFVLVKINVVLGLKSLLLFAIFFVFVQLLILDFYLIFFKLLGKHRESMPIIYPFLLLGYILVSSQGMWDILGYIPVIGWCGKAIESEIMNQGNLVFKAILFYTGSSFFGLLLGGYLMRRH